MTMQVDVQALSGGNFPIHTISQKEEIRRIEGTALTRGVVGETEEEILTGGLCFESEIIENQAIISAGSMKWPCFFFENPYIVMPIFHSSFNVSAIFLESVDIQGLFCQS